MPPPRDTAGAASSCLHPPFGGSQVCVTPKLPPRSPPQHFFTPPTRSQARAAGSGPRPAPCRSRRAGDSNIFLGKGQFNYPVFCFVTRQEHAARAQQAAVQTNSVIYGNRSPAAAGRWIPAFPRAPSLPPGFPGSCGSACSFLAKGCQEREARGKNGVKAKPQISGFFPGTEQQENRSAVRLRACSRAEMQHSSGSA